MLMQGTTRLLVSTACGALQTSDRQEVGYWSEYASNRAFSSTGARPPADTVDVPRPLPEHGRSQVLLVCVADEEESTSGLVKESAEIHEAVEPGMDVAAEVVRGLACVSVHIAAAHLVRARL